MTLTIFCFLLFLFADGILSFYFSWFSPVLLLFALLYLKDRFVGKEIWYFFCVFLFLSWYDLLYRPFPFFSLGFFAVMFLFSTFLRKRMNLWLLQPVLFSVIYFLFVCFVYILEERIPWTYSFLLQNFFIPLVITFLLALLFSKRKAKKRSKSYHFFI